MQKVISALFVGMLLPCLILQGQESDSLLVMRLEEHPLLLVVDQMNGAGLQIKGEASAASPDVWIHGQRLHESMRPLVIVDGVRMVDLSFLSMDDINSVEVITDPVALLRYGNEAIFGVIKITTRRAFMDGFHVDYRGRVGFWGQEESFRHTHNLAFQYKNRYVSVNTALSSLCNNNYVPDHSEDLSRHGIIVNVEANPVKWLRLGLSGNLVKGGFGNVGYGRLWQDVVLPNGLYLNRYLNYSGWAYGEYETGPSPESFFEAGLNAGYAFTLCKNHCISIDSHAGIIDRKAAFRYSSGTFDLYQYWRPVWMDVSGLIGYHWNSCVDAEGGVNYRLGKTDSGRFASLCPAASLRWLVSSTPGLRNVLPKWITQLSLKAEWGKSPVSPSDGTGTYFRSEAPLPEKPVYPIMTEDLEPVYSCRGPSYKDLLILSSRRSLLADMRLSAAGCWRFSAEWYVSDDSLAIIDVDEYAKVRNSGVNIKGDWHLTTGQWVFNAGGVVNYYDNPAIAGGLLPKWTGSWKIDASWSRLGVLAYTSSLYGGQYGLYYGFRDSVLSRIKLSTAKLSFCYEDVNYPITTRHARYVFGINVTF